MVRFDYLFGTCSLSSMSVTGNYHANVYVKNSSGATPLSMTVTSSTFTGSVTHDGFDFFADPSGVASPLGGNMTLSVSGSTFSSNFSDGLFGGVTSNTTTGPGFCFITATTSTFNGNGANGMAIVSAGSSDTKFNIFSNVSISGNPSFGINLFQNNGSTSAAKLRGVVNNNIITYNTVGGGGAGLLLNTQGAGFGAVEITNNTINYNDGGSTAMIVQSGDGLSPGVLNVKTTGNTINVTGANPLRGMLVESGLTSGSTRTVNWHPGVAGGADDTAINRDGAAIGAGVIRMQVRKRPNSFFNIHNLTPSPATTAADVQNFLSSVTGITPATEIFIGAPSTYQINYLAAVVDTSAATGAPLMFASGGVQPAQLPEPTILTAAPTESAAASAEIQAAPAAVARSTPAELTQTELDAAVTAALERWTATGLTSAQLERLKSLSFEISSLPGLHLGEAGADVIRISRHAGGNGWFKDSSRASDALFSSGKAETRRYSEPTAAPAGRIDLLTTVMHEMGHALGLNDSYQLRDRNSLMYGHLTTGERRYPSMGQALGAEPLKEGSPHYLTGAVNIGVLPPGKSVTIIYDVIVNDPATTNTLSSQATVSGGNFTSVLTDDLVTGGDPLLPGASDPTVTLIDLPDVSVTVAPASTAEDGAGNLVYTFARTGDTTNAMTGVNFSLTGTATHVGGDYTVSGGSTVGLSFTFATQTGSFGFMAGSSTATVIVNPTVDTTVELDETVIANVTSGLYDIGAPASATGTITNDDTGVSIDSLPDSSLFEDQTLNFAYTFRRTGVTTGTTVANFSVGGTATFGTDYSQSGATTFTTTTGSVTFAPGETTKVVTLDPTADNSVEGNETIILTVTTGTGYNVVAPTSQTATIVDDDVNVSLTSVVPSTSLEDSGTGMVYTFTRSGGSVANALTVNVTISGTAGFTGDYTTSGFASNNLAGAATITFAGGSATKTVTITPSADVTGESDETVILTVAANGTPAVTGGYAVGGTPSGTGTILNDDTQVSVAVSPGNVSESSGTPMVYTFTRTGSTAAAQVVNFSIGGTAANSADYTAGSSATFTYTPPSGTITIPIGQASATLSVTPATDAIVEANETVILTVTAGAGYVPAAGPNNVATGTINDDDTATVSFAKINDGSEGPPLVNGRFRITQTAQSSTNTVVNYTVGGTAVPGPGNDYAPLSGTATILAGNTTVDVDVIVQADVGSEPPETVIITFSSFGAHDVDITLGAPSSATVTIYSGNTITGTWNGTALISTAGSFDCTGLNLDIDLGFVPVIPSAPLVLIHADGGISGNFNDLPDGGVIALAINGVIYYFQVDYGPNDVTLTPFTPSGPPAWKHQAGPVARNAVAIFGTKGTGADANNPGARQGAMNWLDDDGDLWMFGGYGYAQSVTNPPRYLNDLWRYDRSAGQWIWVSGANVHNQYGTYGSITVPAADNTPGGRHTGTTWKDIDGNLWLFGGYGLGASGALGRLNDLWRFDTGTGQWAHMKGSSAVGAAGVYGAADAPGNTPGARQGATSWATDGFLWLFGGTTDGGTTNHNDLWRYSIASGNWTVIKGSAATNLNGTYAGAPTANTPGARRDATGWIANDDKLWLFGGRGLAATGVTLGDMSDLWSFDPVTGNWTHISGPTTQGSTGTYTALNAAGTPAARSAGSGWVTVDGDLWLVGGFKDSNQSYNDVWIYDIGTGVWTWKLGSSSTNAAGSYGVGSDAPGARFTPSTWVTLNGTLWIFGGGGVDVFGNTGRLSDLWSYGIPNPVGAPWDEAQPEPFPAELIVNADPDASDATAGTMAYVPVSGQLTGSDADGDKLLFSTAGSTVSQGTLTLNANGTWTYTPASGFTGLATFQFQASDNYGGESPVRTLIITVSTNPADNDGDGIADAYEQEIWGGIAAADGDGDADLDGQSNYFEFLAGTDPLDGNEHLATAPSVAGAGTANGTIKLQLNHVRPGVNYHLETSTDLDTWTRLGTFTFSVAGAAEIEDPTPATGAPKFYRMNLEATPAVILP